MNAQTSSRLIFVMLIGCASAIGWWLQAKLPHNSSLSSDPRPGSSASQVNMSPRAATSPVAQGSANAGDRENNTQREAVLNEVATVALPRTTQLPLNQSKAPLDALTTSALPSREKAVLAKPAPSAASLKRPATPLVVAAPAPLGAGMLTRDISPAGEKREFLVGKMWEAQARQVYTPSTTPASAPDWRITGSVVRGSQTFVIVQIDGQSEPQLLKIGSKLPGGATLAWVRPNVIGVREEGSPMLELPVLDGQQEQLAKVRSKLASAPTQTKQ